MTRFVKIFAIALFVLILIFLTLAVLIHFNGRTIVEKRASLMLRRPVTVEKVELTFPLVLRLSGLNVEGLLWANSAEIAWSPLMFLGTKFTLSRVALKDSVLTLHRTSDQQIVWAEHYDETAAAPVSVPSNRHPVEAVIGVLTVNHGEIHFPSHASDEEKSEFSLSSVDLTARNVPLSGQAIDVGFDFWGKIEGDEIPFAGDGLKGSGWINWPARNMDATFGVVNPQGKIDLAVNMNARNNDLMVRGHVKTRRMNLKSEEKADNSMEHLLLDAIQSAGMEIDLDFSFPAKMDRWELRNIEFSGNLNASDEGKSRDQKIEDLKNIGQQFKAVGEQIYEKYNKEEKK